MFYLFTLCVYCRYLKDDSTIVNRTTIVNLLEKFDLLLSHLFHSAHSRFKMTHYARSSFKYGQSINSAQMDAPILV